ncbi:MAG: hypothetical protein RIQ81_1750 [Pseudomonadota bacterium]
MQVEGTLAHDSLAETLVALTPGGINGPKPFGVKWIRNREPAAKKHMPFAGMIRGRDITQPRGTVTLTIAGLTNRPLSK